MGYNYSSIPFNGVVNPPPPNNYDSNNDNISNNVTADRIITTNVVVAMLTWIWLWLQVTMAHDDVIKWKHFPRFRLCAGNSPVSGEFPAQRPVTQSFDIFFHLRMNLRLSNQSRGWWLLWRHCNDLWPHLISRACASPGFDVWFANPFKYFS